ncbi:MAG: 4Fe-4S dicluster domain-containing protein, partial [Firmicutes bacterium]|nr:4Fe-4S dicluster domain-containing protein [Bacillota bacterium]
VQLQINYLDWDTAGIESGKCYDCAVRHGKKVYVMEPVKGGTLANVPDEALLLFKEKHPEWSPADWALRFVQSFPEVEVCLSGMNSMEQVEMNQKEFEPLSNDETEVLKQVKRIIEAKTVVPCTGCRYCVSHCPMGIPIPDYFKMYNELSRYPNEGWKIRPVYVQKAAQTAKASQCLSCRSCEKHCPQHIRICDYIKDVAAAMEE